MRINLKKLLWGLLGFELLAKESTKLLAKSVYSLRRQFRRRLTVWIIRLVLLLLLVGLIHSAVLLGFVALALYLNTWLESSYQGFLLVAGGCMSLLLLCGLFIRVRNLYRS